MKFPKSMHAEGWANHIDSTPSDRSATRRVGVAALRSGARPLTNGTHISESLASPPAAAEAPRVDPGPSAARPQHREATLPPQRDHKLGWMVAAGAGAAVIASVALWAANRPMTPSAPPTLATGSVEPPTEVAAATPAPEATPTAPAEEAGTTAAAAPPPAAEPARLGPPVTTVKPAVEPRRLAQADAPAARPDLVARAAPGSGALEPLRPSPALQPPTAVAAAPAMPLESDRPLTIPPGNAPITLPPTAAGPTVSPGTAPQTPPSASPSTPPVAAATPDTSASAAAATPVAPLAQAPLPSPEDSGITLKVRSALAADSTLAAVPIVVSTDHGVVRLEGQAPDAPTRERATVVASSATGVKAVDNRLTLPPAAVVSQASTQNGL
ncbi:BON domain-containing protein [Roseateles sp. BYS78W]|uniref:BON domain-containing protein n=1 Tax=Pelomonas candidula TaxID=3299025 RepID=A0ABW7HGI8_9BURK